VAGGRVGKPRHRCGAGGDELCDLAALGRAAEAVVSGQSPVLSPQLSVIRCRWPVPSGQWPVLNPQLPVVRRQAPQ